MEEIDWNEVWKSRILKRNASPAAECGSLWKEKSRACRFLEAERKKSREWVENTIDGIRLTKGSRVLDIGAGPGAMALPFARKAAHVTAVEPAAGMADLLEERCAAYGLKNIRCIRKRWEDIHTGTDLCPPYDIVVAAFSLGMADMAESIRKMTAACSGEIHLFWFAGSSLLEARYRDLWPRLHGKPYLSVPKSDVLLNILCRMGIYPHINVFPQTSRLRFSSFEEALREFSFRLGVSEVRQKRDVEKFLKNTLQEDKGSLVFRNSTTCVKMWWKPSEMPLCPRNC